jgi:hypothetical protein
MDYSIAYVLQMSNLVFKVNSTPWLQYQRRSLFPNLEFVAFTQRMMTKEYCF